jgi:hypothetical protein
MDESRRRRIAKRLAPLAFLAALGYLAFQGLRSERAAAEIRFVAGDRAAEVRRLEVELRRPRGEEVLGTFAASLERRRPGGELGRWPLRADAGSYELVIAMELAEGGRRDVRRGIELDDGAVITVDLAGEL